MVSHYRYEQLIANPYIPNEFRDQMISVVYGQKETILKEMDAYWQGSFEEGWWGDKEKADDAMFYLYVESALNEGLDVGSIIFREGAVEGDPKISAQQMLMLDRPPNGMFTETLLNQLEISNTVIGSKESFDITYQSNS